MSMSNNHASVASSFPRFWISFTFSKNWFSLLFYDFLKIQNFFFHLLKTRFSQLFTIFQNIFFYTHKKKYKLKWRCSRHELTKGVIREHTIVIQFPLCSFNSPDAKKMPRALLGGGRRRLQSGQKWSNWSSEYNYSYFWLQLTNKTYCHSENLNCQLFKHFSEVHFGVLSELARSPLALVPMRKETKDRPQMGSI